MWNFRLPGPVELHDDVYLAMGHHMINHRGSDYAELLGRIMDNIKSVFQTENDVLMLNCSGKGALEAVVANLFKPGSSVLVLSNGFFGETLREIVNIYCHVRPSLLVGAEGEVEWGSVITSDLVARALEKHPYVEAVYIVHNETSTGVVNPIREIGEVVRGWGKLFLVDGVSSVGGENVPTDKWGIDVLVTSSQKAIGAPPGVSFVSLSERAWQMYEKSTLPKFYWDFKNIKKFSEKGMPFSTPPLTTVFGVDRALSMMTKEGLENIFERHTAIAKVLWKELEDIGYELFVQDEKIRSHTVTSIKFPEGIDADRFLKILKENYSVEFANGLKRLYGKIFRIGHMGCVTEANIIVLHKPLTEMLNDTPRL